MAQKQIRPLSPHVWHYRWGVHMMASIMHRISGFILATAGMFALLWWLSAIASGEESYAAFQTWVVYAGDKATTGQVVVNWLFRLLGLVVAWSFFQHFFSGLRHLIMDIGAGYELDTNRTWSIAVFIASMTATGLLALYIAWKATGI
jgi:succinate dehydrogenase / fumarate reductase, cytochrome b subunit